ncbi:putative glycerol-3-phosphate acyltransferase PlsY [compost metagenome]
MYYVLCGGILWYTEAPVTAAIVVMGLLLIWRHRENIQRLVAGKESRLGKKKPVAGTPVAGKPEADKPATGKHKGH